MNNETTSDTPETETVVQPKAGGDSPFTPFYPSLPSLWHSLMTAGGNAVEAHPEDESELTQLRERGLVRGRKWIRLTEHGLKLREAISFR